VRQSLEMAVARRCPPQEMLVHSDQGCPYTSSGSLHRLRELEIVVSMSRVGECSDTAAMESCFSTFKGERVERHTFHSRQEARLAIFACIECFYNRVRRHPTLT
jgi:putative transposase